MPGVRLVCECVARVEEALEHDLVRTGDGWRSSCLLDAVRADGRDMLADADAHTAVRRAVEAGVDTLILGCTHYPLLTGVISYVVGDADHLFRTWHPRTRPDDTTPDPGTRWTGLQVLATESDTVEFVASWEGGRMHEVSRFERRARRWFYVDGDVS